MIHCDKGNVKLIGFMHELLAELSCIAGSIFKAATEEGVSDDKAKALVQKAFKYGIENVDDLEETESISTDERMEDSIDHVLSMLEKLVGKDDV